MEITFIKQVFSRLFETNVLHFAVIFINSCNMSVILFPIDADVTDSRFLIVCSSFASYLLESTSLKQSDFC